MKALWFRPERSMSLRATSPGNPAFACAMAKFRKELARKTHGDVARADVLASLAVEFGKATTGKPYLRSALEPLPPSGKPLKLSDVATKKSVHDVSQVLTRTMFDVLMKLVGYFKRTGGRVRN